MPDACIASSKSQWRKTQLDTAILERQRIFDSERPARACVVVVGLRTRARRTGEQNQRRKLPEPHRACLYMSSKSSSYMASALSEPAAMAVDAQCFR